MTTTAPAARDRRRRPAGHAPPRGAGRRPAAQHPADHRHARVPGRTSCCRCSGWSWPRRRPRGTCSARSGCGSPGLRTAVEHPGDAHPRRRHLPALAAQHHAVRGGQRGRGRAAGGRRRVRVRQVPVPRQPRRVRPGARRHHGADHRPGDPDLPAVRKVGLVNTPWADDPALAGQPVRPVPHARLRRGRRPGQPHRGRPHRRRRRGPDLLPDRPAAAGPGLVTVLLFTLVATWNNYFLPLIMLNDPNLYPITVGLASWASQTAGGGPARTATCSSLVVTGSMLSIVPLVVAFLLLQRYWQSGLATGSVKQ